VVENWDRGATAIGYSILAPNVRVAIESAETDKPMVTISRVVDQDNAYSKLVGPVGQIHANRSLIVMLKFVTAARSPFHM